MDWFKYKRIYFTFSALLIVACVVGLYNWGLNIGVDFRGGSVIEYRFYEEISTEEITNILSNEGFQVSSIRQTVDGSYIFQLPLIKEEEKLTINNIIFDINGIPGEELRFETVGPAVGSDLVKKTIYAVIIAATVILIWISYQFKSFLFGISAVLATLHDSFILLGSFAFFGYLYGAEVDFLVITAVLTTLSFSVHDTIVVFDRIRETKAKVGGSITDIANRAVTETMVRSLNNSFTLIFMLVAIILLGGTTIKWFAVALLVGTVFGTYSSPFIAVPIFVILNRFLGRKKLS
jgi:preprotein translocase subunit SecF